MPITLPANLPAYDVLSREGVMVMSDTRAARQDIRQIKIGLLNLMPKKIQTETQFARLIGATPLQIELTLIRMSERQPKNTSAQHLEAFYQTFAQARERRFDGLIVTGAPIEHLEYEAVSYWPELVEVFDWTQTHVHRTMGVCWGGMAMLHHFWGVPKHGLPAKAFGCFHHRAVDAASPYLQGFSDSFMVPVSRWTEVRAVWNRGGHATQQRMKQIEDALPFSIRKLDFDNGTEFLNAHFINYFKGREPQVELSRSRPYRKNDNAHIEQKNYTHVRLVLGDDRFEREELVEPLNEALQQWSMWNNLYHAQRRLVSKERGADGKVKRHHEKRASTPCARLLARKDLSAEQRHKLKVLLKKHDPIELKAQVERQLRAVYAQRARLQKEDEDESENEPIDQTPPQSGEGCTRVYAWELW